MTSLGVMKTRIAGEFPNEKLTAAQIQDAVLEAIRFYKSREFYFNQATVDFTTTIDDEIYTSSDDTQIDDLVKIKWARVTVDGFRHKVTVVDEGWIEDRQTGAVKSDPITHIAYAQQQLRVYPIPTAARTVELFAHIILAELSADGDSNVWTTEGEGLIRHRAKKLIAADVFRAAEMVPAFDLLEMDALAALERETIKRMAARERMPEPMGLGGGAFNIYTDA